MPVFHINSSANIRNRGWAVFGEVTEGAVEPGHWLTFFANDHANTIQIEKIEEILTVSGKPYLALFFSNESKEQQDQLCHLKLTDQMAEIKSEN